MCINPKKTQGMLLSSMPKLPPLQLLHFSSNWSEISYICQVSLHLQNSIINISQGHHMRAQFNKIMSKICKKIHKYDTLLCRGNSLRNYKWKCLLNVIIYIPYFNLTYSAYLKVHVCRETSINPRKIHTGQEMALYKFYVKN